MASQENHLHKKMCGGQLLLFHYKPIYNDMVSFLLIILLEDLLALIPQFA